LEVENVERNLITTQGSAPKWIKEHCLGHEDKVLRFQSLKALNGPSSECCAIANIWASTKYLDEASDSTRVRLQVTLDLVSKTA
jgi:hypothetical protein